MTSYKLPLEILEEIIRLSSRTTQVNLCKTSRVFRILATRSLYKNIKLTNSSSLMLLCNTLRSNPVAASCIKCFSVSYLPMKPPYIAYTVYFAPFYRNLKEAFLRLNNLQEFSLLVRDPILVKELFDPTAPALHYPSLRRFETHLPLDHFILSFIVKHPTLNYLEVSRHENVVFDDAVNLTPIPQTTPTLRRLHHFVGNSVYLERLAPVYPLPLRSAHVFWNATNHCQGPVLSLASAASDTLNILSCRRRGWNRDLIGLITKHLPDIYALHITNVLVVDAELPEGYQEEITYYLSRCRRLQRFKLTREVQWSPSELQYDVGRELSIVSNWGAACPSLLVITLPHSYLHIEWHRTFDNTWAPVNIPLQNAARQWRKGPVRS